MRKKILASVGALVAAIGLAVGGFAVAGAAGASHHDVHAADNYYLCVASGNKPANSYPDPGWHGVQCPVGQELYLFPSRSAFDAAVSNLQSQINALGPVTASATTSVTNWPETGGWALDNFNRQVQVQRGAAVDASKCGASAQTCFFYTGTISDSGTFVTADGAPTPNGGDGAATISGVNHGTMNGGSKIEFYASSPTPNGSLVPATMDGHTTVGTSDWAKQLFPSGTAFGSFALPTYSWTYAATSPANCEQWVDSINPGDDGSSSADGNITGENHCTE